MFYLVRVAVGHADHVYGLGKRPTDLLSTTRQGPAADTEPCLPPLNEAQVEKDIQRTTYCHATGVGCRYLEAHHPHGSPAVGEMTKCNYVMDRMKRKRSGTLSVMKRDGTGDTRVERSRLLRVARPST